MIQPPPLTIAGQELRILSLATFRILALVENEFISPRGPDGTMADGMLAIAQYCHIHLRGAIAVEAELADREAFDFAVKALAEEIPFAQVPAIQARIQTELDAVRAARIDVRPRPGSEDKDAPPNS